jgi:hypothetical protein
MLDREGPTVISNTTRQGEAVATSEEIPVSVAPRFPTLVLPWGTLVVPKVSDHPEGLLSKMEVVARSSQVSPLLAPVKV